jgi:hypothetical protein
MESQNAKAWARFVSSQLGPRQHLTASFSSRPFEDQAKMEHMETLRDDFLFPPEIDVLLK